MTIDAFELIAPRLRSAALNKAAAMGLNYDESQDIAQETLLRLWQMRDDKRLYNPEGFAAVIAHRLSLNHLRRKPPLPLESRERASQTISPLDEIIQQEDVQWLEQKINELPYNAENDNETIFTTSDRGFARQIHGGQDHH